MADKDTHRNNPDWLDENENSPEASQSHPRKIHVTMDHFQRTKAQVYATGNKWAIENFNATHY